MCDKLHTKTKPGVHTPVCAHCVTSQALFDVREVLIRRNILLHSKDLPAWAQTTEDLGHTTTGALRLPQPSSRRPPAPLRKGKASLGPSATPAVPSAPMRKGKPPSSSSPGPSVFTGAALRIQRGPRTLMSTQKRRNRGGSRVSQAASSAAAQSWDGVMAEDPGQELLPSEEGWWPNFHARKYLFYEDFECQEVRAWWHHIRS